MGVSALEGRIALVTGASSGIGRAIAAALAVAGASVVAVGRDGGRLDETIAAAGPAAGRVEAAICDLTDDEAVRAFVDRIAVDRGSLDVLVHAAGDIAFGTVEEASTDRLDALVRINLRAPYVLTRSLLPILRANRGHIVFVNSSAAIRPSAGVAAYGATKHALHGLATALRDEVAPAGIRVTTLFAGRTRTPMQASVYRWEGRGELGDGLLEPEDIAAMVVAVLALPPTTEVTDLHIRPASPSEDRGGPPDPRHPRS